MSSDFDFATVFDTILEDRQDIQSYYFGRRYLGDNTSTRDTINRRNVNSSEDRKYLSKTYKKDGLDKALKNVNRRRESEQEKHGVKPGQNSNDRKRERRGAKNENFDFEASLNNFLN